LPPRDRRELFAPPATEVRDKLPANANGACSAPAQAEKLFGGVSHLDRPSRHVFGKPS
jgi:hypothetical protein